MLCLLDKHAIPFVSVECDASPLRGSSAGSHRVHCSYPHSPSHQTPCDSSQMCLVDWVCGILDIGCFSRKTGRYALTPTRCTTSFRFWLPLNTSPFLLCIILPFCNTIHDFSPRGWGVSPLSAQGNDLCLTPIRITEYDLVEESESVGKRFATSRVMTVNHGLQSAAGIYSMSVQCADRT